MRWVAHYVIGTAFALIFVSFASGSWLERPTLMPALAFGVATTLIPFLIMQPSFGLGIAASKTSHPNQARLKGLMTHTVFGVGLYIWALLLSQVLFRASRRSTFSHGVSVRRQLQSLPRKRRAMPAIKQAVSRTMHAM